MVRIQQARTQMHTDRRHRLNAKRKDTCRRCLHAGRHQAHRIKHPVPRVRARHLSKQLLHSRVLVPQPARHQGACEPRMGVAPPCIRPIHTVFVAFKAEQSKGTNMGWRTGPSQRTQVLLKGRVQDRLLLGVSTKGGSVRV